jgi:SAM-dependent methyltransferase
MRHRIDFERRYLLTIDVQVMEDMASRIKEPAPGSRAGVYDPDDRYADNWVENFTAQYEPYLRLGMTILDVGSGRTPAIPVDKRPQGCRYIGLDVSADELALAPPGSYDQTYVSDLRVREESLVGQVDLAISWQVLEHVEPLADALDNVRGYLRPGGHFVALLSGKYALFSIINRLIPERIGVFAMERLLRRPPDTVFRAQYDACTHRGLTQMLAAWRQSEVIALYRGAGYLEFFPPVRALYLWYEDWVVQRDKKELATHYVVVASR